jgi:hypothetical protein
MTFFDDDPSRGSVDDVKLRLTRQTSADTCIVMQTGSSKVVYRLMFSEDIGFDWLKSQVKEIQEELDEPLQMWEIEPSQSGYSVVSVKEVNPRYEIDRNQSSLSDHR